MTVRAVSNNPASPVYNANAPGLTGQAGSLTTLLDAVLVNGFTGFTALGWSINQTTTNKRGYKQNLTGANNSSGMLLYVDDTGPGAGGAKEARVCGFETMSAITPTGTGQFPTGAQSSIGTGQLVIRKSATADATARLWTIVGNGQTIYLFIESGDITAPTLAAFLFVFGDFKSYKASDQYAVCIIGRNTENSASANVDPFQMIWPQNASGYNLSNIMFGHFVARHWTGSGGSIKVGKVSDLGRTMPSALQGFNTGGWTSDGQTTVAGNCLIAIGRNSATNTANAPMSFPNGPDGSMWLSPIYLNHSMSIRGYLPGLWAPLQDRPLTHNDTLTVSGGNLNGKSLLAQAYGAYISSANDYGIVVSETSDTWS